MRSPSPWASGLRSPSPATPTPPSRPKSKLAGVAGGTEPELNVAVAGLVELLTTGLGEISAPAKSFSDSDDDFHSDVDTATPRTQSRQDSVGRSGAPSRTSIDSPPREVWSTEPCLFQPPSPTADAEKYAATPELGPEFLAELEETARTNAEIASVWESLSEKIGRCNHCLGDLQNVGKDGKHRFEISAEEMAALRQGHYDHNVDDRGLTFREFVQRRGFQVSASCVDRLLGSFHTKVTVSHLKRVLKGRNKASARITENQLVVSEHRAARNEPRTDAVLKVQQRLNGLLRTRERCIRNLGRRKALAIELVGVPQSGRRALEAELQKVRAKKRQLNEAGDSLAAHAQRKREEQILTRLREDGGPKGFAVSETQLQVAVADVERRARMTMSEFRDLARVGIHWPEQPAAILERLDEKMKRVVKRRRDMAAEMVRLKKQIWKAHCKWKRATREAKSPRPCSVAELQEERQALREKLATISMVSLLRQWQRFKAERHSTLTDYRAAKTQLRPHFEAALQRWRSGAAKNPFKRFMMEETLQGTTTGLNSRSSGVSAGPAEDLVSQMLLQERERKLDNKQKPLGVRWRMLRAQHLSYYRFLKSHLRHLQKADFLNPVLILIGSLRRETDQSIIDTEASLYDMKVALQEDKQRMAVAMQAAVMHLTGKKTVERRGKKFEHYLLECTKHVDTESEFIASLQILDGLKSQVDDACVGLVAMAQIRPFPVAIAVHQRVQMAEVAEAAAKTGIEQEDEEPDASPTQRTGGRRAGFLGQRAITSTAFSVEEVDDKASQASGSSRRAPMSAVDENSDLKDEEEFTMEGLAGSVKAATAAAYFVRKTVLPWSMLIEKREEVMHRLKQSRAYFVSARSTAMQLERRRFVQDLSSNELIRRKFFVKCRATFEQMRADFRQNRLDPLKANLAAASARATELDSQVRQLKTEAVELQHELSRVRMEVAACEEVIHERPRQQMKHDLVDEAASKTHRSLKDAKEDIVQLHTDISMTTELQRRIRQKTEKIIKCMCRLDKQETRRLVEGDKALAPFKEVVQAQQSRASKRSSNLNKAELTHALQSLEAAIQGADPGASSSSGSEDSQGRPRRSVAKTRSHQSTAVPHRSTKGPSLNASALAWVGRQIRKRKERGAPVTKKMSQERGRRTVGTKHSRVTAMLSSPGVTKPAAVGTGPGDSVLEEPETQGARRASRLAVALAAQPTPGDAPDPRKSALEEELLSRFSRKRQDSPVGDGAWTSSVEQRRASQEDSRRPSKDSRRPSKEAGPPKGQDSRRPSKDSRRPSKAPSSDRSSRGPGSKDPSRRPVAAEDNLQEARDVAAAVACRVREQDKKRKKAGKRLKGLWSWAQQNLHEGELKEFTSMPEFQEIVQMEEREKATEAEAKQREQQELESVLAQMAEARKQVAERLEQTRLELQKYVKEPTNDGGVATDEATNCEATAAAAEGGGDEKPTPDEDPESQGREGTKNTVLEVVEGLLANSPGDFETEEVAFSLNRLGMSTAGGELDQQIMEMREAEIREQEREAAQERAQEQEEQRIATGRISSQSQDPREGSLASEGSEFDTWERRDPQGSEHRRESQVGYTSEAQGTEYELVDGDEVEQTHEGSQEVRRADSRRSDSRRSDSRREQRQPRPDTTFSIHSDDDEAAIAASLGEQIAVHGVADQASSEGTPEPQRGLEGRSARSDHSAARQQLELPQQELPASRVPSTQSMTSARSLIQSAAPGSEARHRVMLSVIAPGGSHTVPYVTPLATTAFPPSAPARLPRKASKRTSPAATPSSLQIVPSRHPSRSPSPSPSPGPSDSRSEAAAAALAVTNVSFHTRMVSKESASCVDETEFPSRLASKEQLRDMATELEEMIGRQSGEAAQEQEQEGPTKRRVLRMMQPHLLFEIPSEYSAFAKADLSLTALAGPRPARPALLRRQLTAGQDSALLHLPSAPMQVKPLLPRQAQEQPDGVYAGLKVFVHEFQDERGVMVDSRVDYFVRRPVPGEDCWWRLQELEEDFWGANGCCTVTMRWRPQHPVSHHSENRFCIIRKASFPEPGLLKIQFVSFAGDGEEPLPEPEMALLSWSGGGARPVRVEEVRRQRQVNEVLEGQLFFEIRSSLGELRFTLGEGFEPVALAAPLHLSSSPATAQTKGPHIHGLVDLKSLLRPASRGESPVPWKKRSARDPQGGQPRRATKTAEDFARRTAQRAESRALSLTGKPPVIERQRGL